MLCKICVPSIQVLGVAGCYTIWHFMRRFTVGCTTYAHHHLYQILDVLRPVNRDGSYQGEIKCILTTSTHFGSLLNTHSTIEDLQKFGDK